MYHLYTNIPHEGKQSVLHFLQHSVSRPEQPIPEVLIDIVLKNNVFEFNYKSKEQQWVPKWHPHMQTYLWEN